jgi:hypothetical protein
VGKWLSQDPSGLGPDTNTYRYVGNAPMSAVDPTGLSSWSITTDTGKEYSGSGGPDLLEALYQVDRDGQTITTMNLKGHGYGEGITEGMFSQVHLIRVIEDERTTIIDIVDKAGVCRPINILLKRITDAKTKINLSACFSDDAARKMSKALPKVQVQGFIGPAFSIPGTYHGVGLPGHTYVGGSAEVPPMTNHFTSGGIIIKCFGVGTPVLCPEGPRPIDSIQQGDRVLAYDLERKLVVESRVLRSEVFLGAADILAVDFPGGNGFNVTTHHPFFNGTEWVRSTALALGAKVLNASGMRVVVSVTQPRQHAAVMTFNLRTEHKTYLVGNTGLVVADRDVPVSARTRFPVLA